MTNKKMIDVLVLQRFRDKTDRKTIYEAGMKLQLDEDRATDCVTRGLVEEKMPEA